VQAVSVNRIIEEDVRKARRKLESSCMSIANKKDATLS
jgi:hypothetical protein